MESSAWERQDFYLYTSLWCLFLMNDVKLVRQYINFVCFTLHRFNQVLPIKNKAEVISYPQFRILFFSVISETTWDCFGYSGRISQSEVLVYNDCPWFGKTITGFMTRRRFPCKPILPLYCNFIIKKNLAALEFLLYLR